MKHFYHRIITPIGPLHALADTHSLTHLVFDKEWQKLKTTLQDLEVKKTQVLALAEKQLKEYFNGQRTNFDIPLKIEGTQFQKKAWQALHKIPFGKTLNYQQQAIKIKQPKATRAVGSANGKNPICIIVPCHRVISKTGGLGGYAGGIHVKKQLLKLEGLSFS